MVVVKNNVFCWKIDGMCDVVDEVVEIGWLYVGVVIKLIYLVGCCFDQYFIVG